MSRSTTRAPTKHANPPPKGGHKNSPAMSWAEPCSCQGPNGERHAVRLGNDGRVCYFGEANLPGDWVLETIPFPNTPSTFSICAGPDGVPYVACVCDNGEVWVAWREGPNDWGMECVGKNGLPNEPCEVASPSPFRFNVSFACWNPMNDSQEHRFVECGRKYAKSTLYEPGRHPNPPMEPHPKWNSRRY